MTYLEKYALWLEKTAENPELAAELKACEGKDAEIEDRFYKDLEFGTGGLRGVIGAGTNRMNIYTVGKATQGLAEHVKAKSDSPKAAIAYDSRINSELFARTAAEVFAANGVHVYIYPELMPTPAVSFAIRHLKCDVGIIVTASHNPSKYNGYKAYGADGCQLGLTESEIVIENVNKIDPFSGVKSIPFEDALKRGDIEYIGQETVNAFLDAVAEQQIHPGSCEKAPLKLIYTPLHGAGNKPVRSILERIGIKNITVVPEQELPDGNFPTAPYPNPETREAFACALKLAEKVKPDLLLATDPDADRVGIAVRRDGEYILVSGNEVGALLLNYIITGRIKNGTLPENPVAVKTIVTTELCAAICEKYGVELLNVLTGFKFIGEKIAELEARGEENRYIFGFEESYGYLAGTHVRDKDAVVASMLICEMAAYYSLQGKSLLDVLDELFEEFGTHISTQKSFTCEGVTGMQRMAEIMAGLKSNTPRQLAGQDVISVGDYAASLMKNLKTGKEAVLTLPKSDVLEYKLQSGSVIVRPSGTEPKIKVYLNIKAASRVEAEKMVDELEASITELMGF